MSSNCQPPQRWNAPPFELLASLDTEQCQRISYQFNEETERRSWFYTPTDHGGLPLADISPLGQQHVFRLLAAGLSARRLTLTATLIMGVQPILDRLERWLAPGGGQRRRELLLFYVSIFGNPGSRETWGWRFGGHHLDGLLCTR
jgi:hypothetical protein